MIIIKGINNVLARVLNIVHEVLLALTPTHIPDPATKRFILEHTLMKSKESRIHTPSRTRTTIIHSGMKSTSILRLILNILTPMRSVTTFISSGSRITIIKLKMVKSKHTNMHLRILITDMKSIKDLKDLALVLILIPILTPTLTQSISIIIALEFVLMTFHTTQLNLKPSLST